MYKSRIIVPMEIDVKSLLSELGIDYHAEGAERNAKGVASVYEANENSLTMCYYEGEKGISIVSNSNAGIILCPKSMEGFIHPKTDENQCFLFVDKPKIALIHIINRSHKNNKRMVGVSERAVLSETARIGSDCYIGENAVIGENCIIGDSTIIYDNVTILQNSLIGKNCIIQSGVRIGADGFAYERYESGELVKFPHLAGVKIGNDVEICSNSDVARGSLSDTIIGDGTKIDSSVHIAHNVVLGENCIITAGTTFGGSTKIGNMCWTGLNSTLKDRLKIGNRVLIAAGALVISDVQDEDIVAGVPAKSIKEKVTTNKLFLMAGQKEKHL